MMVSYHPSNQNTATGKLTEEMFTQVFQEAAKVLAKLSKNLRG